MRIITAGMYRSGTTWQFNAVRVLMELEHGEENVYSCWVDNYEQNDKKVEIIKTHKGRKSILKDADFIVTTYRRPEEIKGSMQRRAEYLKKNPDPRFSAEANVGRFEEFMRLCDKFWKPKAHYIQDFDKIKGNTKELIDDYIDLFRCKNVTAQQVMEELDKQMKVPTKDYDPKTLLHHGHITKE